MKLLSLDISSKDTGWALFDNLSLVNYGLLDIDKYKENKVITNSTLHSFGDMIYELLLEQEPDRVAVENIYIGLNKTAGIKLGMMSGIARYLSYQATGFGIQTIFPSEVNRALGMKTLKSADRKRQLVDNINTKFKLKLLKREHDTADAIGIGMVAMDKILKNLKKKFI